MAVKLKICGLTRVADLRACEELGVDAVGFNLWAGSRRGLGLPEARELLAAAGQVHCARVGVFVDAEPAFVREAIDALRLDYLQPHGDRPVDAYARLGHPYVWVIRGTPELARLRVPAPAPAWAILDAASEAYGGQGRATDWAWARAAVEHLAPLPVWLAGGVHPDNAAQAIARVRPAGLDVASGAEASGAARGEKDAERIRRLLAVCRVGVSAA